MKTEIDKIIDFEENKDFEKAFNAYNNLYSLNKSDFEVWKNFFFFLWIIINICRMILLKKLKEKVNSKRCLPTV